MSAAGFAATYSAVPVQAPSGFSNIAMGGVNNSGQVAGYGTVGTTTQAFIGSPSASALIPLPSGWTSSQGIAINASSQVVGTVYNATTSAAFIGTTLGSAVIPLPPPPFLPGGFSSYVGSAINDFRAGIRDAE